MVSTHKMVEFYPSLCFTADVGIPGSISLMICLFSENSVGRRVFHFPLRTIQWTSHYVRETSTNHTLNNDKINFNAKLQTNHLLPPPKIQFGEKVAVTGCEVKKRETPQSSLIYIQDN